MVDRFPYWTDPLKDEFSIVIAGCERVEDHFEILIDDEVVRAEEGGQAGDRGTLRFDGERVEFKDTRNVGGRPALVSEEHIEPGVVAHLIIDMGWRRAMMRNHTGEHLFVASIKRTYPESELGYIWIDGNQGTVDIEGVNLGFEALLEGERQVQLMIDDGLPVKTKFVSATELSSDVRAREGLSDKYQMMRIVEVDDIDSSACSGIHVTNTRDIEVFKILDFKTRGSTNRVTFATGNRARDLLRSTYNEVLQRRHSYPFEVEHIGEVLDKAKSITDERKHLLEKLTQFMTGGLSSESISDLNFIHESIPGLDSKTMKSILKKMRPSGPTAILLFSPGEKCILTFWTHELLSEAKDYIGAIVERMGGQGGGSREVYTGGFTEVSSPEEVYTEIINNLRVSLKG